MRELIDERTANLVMNLLAIGLPLLGLGVGSLVGFLRGRPASGALGGLAVGGVGILNWLLWRMYNAVTNHYGLDTVRNLLVNLALFVAIGVAAGVAVGFWTARRRIRS